MKRDHGFVDLIQLFNASLLSLQVFGFVFLVPLLSGLKASGISAGFTYTQGTASHTMAVLDIFPDLMHLLRWTNTDGIQTI